MSTVVKRQIAMFCLLVLAACGYHPPAPIEEHSGSQANRPLNPDGSYRVMAGDTLYAIAFSLGMDHREIAAWNRIRSPYFIYPGQNLRLSAPLPGKGRKSVENPSIRKPTHTTTRASKTDRSSPVKATSASKKPAIDNVSSQNLADPKSWKWPVNGPVLRGFVDGDPSRNGMDIAGKQGQAIIAAAAGKVVYSGSGLIGYGELIIIKHSERMLSAYAHNKVRLVHEGEQVAAAQKIAEMGRNDQNEQLLHFEIRIYGKPVNPIVYLPQK